MVTDVPMKERLKSVEEELDIRKEEYNFLRNILHDARGHINATTAAGQLMLDFMNDALERTAYHYK